LASGVPNKYASASHPTSRINTSEFIECAKPLFKVEPKKLDEEGNELPAEEGPGPIGLIPDIRSDAK